MSGPQKLLILAGAALIAIGLAWPWLSRLGLGRLPGDFVIRGENSTFYFPLTTMIIISIVLTIIVRFLNR